MQLPPYGQAELIQVSRGNILDVNVDIRRSSPTFGRHVTVKMESAGWNQIFLPERFGYVTLADDTEVVLKLNRG